MKLFSFILSAAYWVNSWNCSFVSTFLARAKISKQISLKTRSAHPIFASSISSLQAVYRVSFIGFCTSFLAVLFVFYAWFLRLIVCDLGILICSSDSLCCLKAFWLVFVKIFKALV